MEHFGTFNSIFKKIFGKYLDLIQTGVHIGFEIGFLTKSFGLIWNERAAFDTMCNLQGDFYYIAKINLLHNILRH